MAVTARSSEYKVSTAVSASSREGSSILRCGALPSSALDARPVETPSSAEGVPRWSEARI
eukprot:4668494-Pleurochrysis_carterae.AAC.3